MDQTSLDLNSAASSFTELGYPYVALFILLLQITIIPLAGWFIKRYSVKTKRIIDLEREVTKQERDRREFEIRQEKDTSHRIEELNATMDNLSKTLNRLFTRLDEMLDKTNRIYTELEVIKRSGR